MSKEKQLESIEDMGNWESFLNRSIIQTEAASCLMERFPSLGLMSWDWEPKEPIEESLPSFKIEKAECFYFYGLKKAEAYFQCKKWLQMSSEHRLVFLEDDPGIIAFFLTLPEALEVLSHPQVHLEFFSNKEEEMDLLAQKFPYKRVEVAGLKSKKGLKKLRLKLLRKTTLSFALHLDRIRGDLPFKNLMENLIHLPRSFYANGLKGSFANIPAVVCGAGPSLQKSIPTLKTLENKALIIAGGSTLAALSSQGVLPHFGMAIDPNFEEYKRLRNSFAFEVPLLYSTRVHPEVFHTCNGPFGYMRSGIGGILELWLEEEIGLIDPLLGHLLSKEACSVTSICIAWAQFLGCNPILLNGIDLAYTEKKHYSSGVIEEKKLSFSSLDKERSAADRIIRRKDRNGKWIFTAVRWVMESASISEFAKSYPDICFINTTEGGIGFRGIRECSLEEAVFDFKERELRKCVHEKIQENPMPQNTKEIIFEKRDELRKSLEKVIESLQILSGKQKGSIPLAEFELKEEIAYLYLFYDIYQVLKPGERFWSEWLDLALQYQKVFDSK